MMCAVFVTSNVERIYPFKVLLLAAETGLDRDSKARLLSRSDRSRSIGWGGRLGVVPNVTLLDIDEALRLHPGLLPATAFTGPLVVSRPTCGTISCSQGRRGLGRLQTAPAEYTSARRWPKSGSAMMLVTRSRPRT